MLYTPKRTRATPTPPLRMKTFFGILVIACGLSIGLTFFLFAERDGAIDPIREQYGQVFERFDRHAEAAYHRYDDAYGLEILHLYDIEGLRILKEYGTLIKTLQPYLDVESLVALCREYGSQLAVFIEHFQPTILADIQNQYGQDAIRYILEQPERYFLLKTYGDRIVQLANEKGPIVFDLLRAYQPEFIELYYDDTLFKTINHFGVDGLIAIKTYRGMATTIFKLFADDNRFETVFRKYGHQQLIPVLYYFYQTEDTDVSLTDRLTQFELHNLFQPASETIAADESPPPISDEITKSHSRFDRANWALDQIYVRGNTFLRQFEISDSGTVTLLPMISFANLFDELFLISPSQTSSLQTEQNPISQSATESSITCEQFALVLDILGILPPETVFSNQARCAILRSEIATATSLKGIEGLITLDEQQDIVARYGTTAVPFISQYGKEGLRLIQETEGEILRFALVYGQDLIQFTIKYGPGVLDLVNEFGGQMIEAIRETQGEIIPYAQQHGKAIFRLLDLPEGKAILALAEIFGEDIITYTLRYPADFPRFLLKYGTLSVKALEQYDGALVELALKHGDDVIFYAGQYGDDALRLISRGSIGVFLLRAIPEERLEQNDRQFLQTSLPRMYFSLLIRSPKSLHRYIGSLGEATFSLAPWYFQLFFWTLVLFIVLSIVRWLFIGIKRMFVGP